MIVKALRAKLRFQSPTKGLVTLEQLWDLKQADLESMLRELNGKLVKKVDDDLDFLTEVKETVDSDDKIKFEVIKSVYITKKSELEAKYKEAEIKRHNNEIDALIASKQKDALASKSIEELQALRK